MDEVETVSVALTVDQVAQLRRMVAAGETDSISSYVAEAVRIRLDRDQSLTELKELFDRKGHGPGEEHLAWARDVLGVGDDDKGTAT
jgi:Arc/MetJ-type ribon-helix-helix transcriptional regulator